MKLQDFWYELPERAIAQEPLGERDGARLLVDRGGDLGGATEAGRVAAKAGGGAGGRATGAGVEHRRVAELPELLRNGDVVVVNDARVLPARMTLWKATGGEVEVLALRPLGGSSNSNVPEGGDRQIVIETAGNEETSTGGREAHEGSQEGTESSKTSRGWEALVRPSRRVQPGAVLHLEDGRPVLRVGKRLAEGKREIFPVGTTTLEKLMAQAGEVPLPPYIHTPLEDSERYQSIYAKDATAAAAPTAGLHLTQRVLDGLAAKGIPVYALNLAVGLGTFRPITEDDIADHHIHTEEYHIPAETWQACLRAKQQGGRVVAIGTTVVRALETAHSKAHCPREAAADTEAATNSEEAVFKHGGEAHASPCGVPSGLDTEEAVFKHGGESSDTDHLHRESDLYITPGYRFGMVDVLMTNFHLPHSTLLVLLAAFMGPRWRELYETALAEGYRFLSFGDAMLVERQ